MWQPGFLPGLSASLDLYDIVIKDAVGTLGGQTTINQCLEGATQLCSLLHRDTAGVLVSVDTPFLNIAERSTRGFDAELGYRLSLGGGNLSLRALGTYIDELITKNPGAAVIDAAGQTGGGGGVPHVTANFSAQYRHSSGFGVFVQERYLGSGWLDKTLTTAQLAPQYNHVASVLYTDLTLTQSFGEEGGEGRHVEVFATINNVFDKDPPSAPQAFFVFGTSMGNTNPNLFDFIGRQYSAGVRLRF